MNNSICRFYVLLAVPFLCFAVDVGKVEAVARILAQPYNFSDVTHFKDSLDFAGNVAKTNDCIVVALPHLSIWGRQFDIELNHTNEVRDSVVYHLTDMATHASFASIEIKDYSTTSNAVDYFCLRACHSSMPIESRMDSFSATNISGIALFSERNTRNSNGWTNNVFAIYGRSSVQVRSSSNAVDIALAVIEAGTRKEEASEKSEDADGDGNK